VAERNESKKRRQAQNRAERAERAARAAAAKTAAEERRAERAPDPVESRRASRRANESPIVSGSIDDEPIVPADPAPQAPASRRSRSAVFSARHRNEVAAANASGRPARTHREVAIATGTELVAASVVRQPATASSAVAATTANDRRAGSTRTATATQRSGAARPAKARPVTTTAPRQVPPGRPLPAWLDRFGGNEPGGRWVIMSFLTILLASAVLSLVKIVPEQIKKNGKFVATGRKVTIWHFGTMQGLVYLLPPILVVGLSIVLARPGNRRRNWNMALLLLVFVAFMLGAIPIFIVSIACLAWGCWLARKAALAEVGGDPAALRMLERERRLEDRAAMRAARKPSSRS
jgi:hypothetical protein